MSKTNALLTACFVTAALTAPEAFAKSGKPHSLSATANFTEVTLTWQAPNAEKKLQWHNDYAYNGDDGTTSDYQKPVEFYSGALFTADDLKANVGEVIEAISFYQYRPVISATVVVFEDGAIVSETQADPTTFKKDEVLRVALEKPVTIKAGSEYRFAVRWIAGQNLDMVAIKDQASEVAGRGDQFSLDGVNWISTGDGDYLVTAHLANDVDEAPTGYTVYRGTSKVADTAETTAVLSNEPEGKNEYSVEATYTGATHRSASATVNVRSLASTHPSPTASTPTVNGLDVALAWTAPLTGGSELTWGTKTNSVSIGGTASSNTKVWIKNEFEATDLPAFAGGKISGLNTYFAEACVTAVTAWVMCDGKIVTFEKASGEKIAAITAGSWLHVDFSEPVAIEAGHKYAYGVYVLHTPKMHPIGVSDALTVNTKGNSFSTSSPNSTNFLNSKPSWKTLRSGGIEGNWMLTADISDAPATVTTAGYDIYRNGTLVKTDLTATTFDDTVEKPDTYEYAIVARDANGHTSEPATCQAVVKLPAEYSAPVLESATFDAETRTVAASWNTDKELAKHGEATYVVGFKEDMAMMWGTQFTKADLEPYKGYTITKIKFAIGDAVTGLKVGVYTPDGKVLAEEDLSNETITPLAFYTLKLSKPVTIDGTTDVILAYSGTLAANTDPIILDGGPLTPNGARVSLTGGTSWMNLGTIQSAYDGYNIIISALAGDTTPAAGPAKVTPFDASIDTETPLVRRTKAVEATELGVAAPADYKAPAVQARATSPKVTSFNIYRNGEIVAKTTERSFSEVLNKHNIFNYFVTAVYANGWESAASATFTVNNGIDQKAVAPYGLSATESEGNLTLEWQSSDKAAVLSYVTDETNYLGLGMTGSNPTSHVAVRFSTEDLVPHIGKAIDHVQFMLYTADVTSLSVIVLVGENIVYRQSVAVEGLKAGLNDVRLNEPYIIPAGAEVGVGYVTKYPTGLKPLGMDAGTATPGYGDLISSSGSAGYWYSLKTKFSMDHNWWVKAILSTPDQELNTADATATTYNVYLDGTPVKTGLTSTSVLLEKAASGRYYVTAVDAEGVESGESNSVYYTAKDAVNDIVVDSEANAPVEYFNLQGARLSNPVPGTTVIRRQGSTITKEIIK